MQLVDIYNSYVAQLHQYVQFQLTAQSKTILSSTSKEEQPEDRSQASKVGIPNTSLDTNDKTSALQSKLRIKGRHKCVLCVLLAGSSAQISFFIFTGFFIQF